MRCRGVEDAGAGLSPTTVTRLLTVWQDEYQAWRKRSLVGKNYVYPWADGVHFNVRLEEDRLACLTVLGVLPDGRKEVVALEDGYRESTASWKALLRGPQASGAAGTQAGHCGRRSRLLGGIARHLSRNRGTALLGPQNR